MYQAMKHIKHTPLLPKYTIKELLLSVIHVLEELSRNVLMFSWHDASQDSFAELQSV